MKFPILGLIRFYKAVLSPFLPPSCRFQPTCSTYAMEAVEKYGAIRGTWLAAKRILRCQPFCKGGFDPIP
jgi:putative membrane protein insertion efficiency factor